MNADRWGEVERVFHEAVEQRPQDRAAWLAAACGADEDLRREVESLLEYQEPAEGFIESPALEIAAINHASERAAAAEAGQTIHHYKISAALGTGGVGEVYLAEDTRLHRSVALKLLAVDLTRDGVHLRRFEREARAIAALSHPNVCVIHDVIETADGRQCIVMEYVEGVTLRTHLAGRTMKVAEALDVAIQVASALSAAHAAGIVHRDIKPENIMLRSDGYAKVLDFGLAKLTGPRVDDGAATHQTEVSTAAGALMGTVRYMSPEQTRGLPVDGRTDIWSLGVVLYEMVSGRPPFAGPTLTEVMCAITESDPVPLATFATEAPVRLEKIVKKAMEKNPEDRYPSASDLLADLKNVRRDLELDDTVRDERRPAGGPASMPPETAAHMLVQADRAVPLGEGENIVGRDPSARIRSASGSISRRHAAIIVEGENATIVDLGSKNGTFVDGDRVVEPRPLRDGMKVVFGTMEMVYRWAPAHRQTESIG